MKKVSTQDKQIKSILISQPAPKNGRSPYLDLAEKYGIQLDFVPFISVQGLKAKDFRKQRVDINSRTALIFTSRHSIDHFFRICDEMKIRISQEMKYFCVRKTVALYLQKYVQYRKRKVFYPNSGRRKDLLDILDKYKKEEKFLLPGSKQSNNEIPNWLKKNKTDYKRVYLYETVSNDVKGVLDKGYDLIVFFSPSGVQSLFENVPDFQQEDTIIAAVGDKTSKAVKAAKLRLDIKAPTPKFPSMVTAIESLLKQNRAK